MIQNTLNCPSYAPNQGLGSCQYVPEPWLGMLAIKKGRSFSATELLDFVATISTGLVADDLDDRIYDISKFNTVTPESNDPVTQTLDDGSMFVTREVVWNLNFIAVNTSYCKDKALQQFNNAQDAFDFIPYDINYRFLGQNVRVAGTNELRFGGVSFSYINVLAQTLTTFTARAQSQIKANLLNVKAFQANMAIADLSNTTINSVLGLNGGIQNVVLTRTGGTTTTLKVTAVTNCGGQPLGLVSGYAAAANFALYNVTDAAAIVPSGVAANASTGEITFTFTAQTSGDVITLQQTAPSVVEGNTGLWLETPQVLTTQIP